jgi:DNA-binding transcriptional ArsR family regulator
MVQSKTELFTPELTETARLLKALSHPARLRILKFLGETSACITGDISEDLPLGRTTVNQHLKELKEVGLIQGHVEGVKTNYCLNPEKIMALKNTMNEFIDSLNTSNYSCK